MSRKKYPVIILTVTGILAYTNASANPATVSFNGSVSGGTCTMTADSMSSTVIMNDITASSIAAAGSTTSMDANNGNIEGAEVPVPAINFVNCPLAATKIRIASLTTSGSGYGLKIKWTPASGTARGVWLGLAAKTTAGGYTLCSGNASQVGDCKSASNVYFPVAGGSATTGSDGIKIFAYKNADTPASGIVAGNYATTFTMAFNYE